MSRTTKENYYLDIAQTVSERSTCIRRRYGAIIVKNDEIIATGYNGSPRGRTNCIDIGSCIREQMGIPRGERYELCRSVHSEANAIISASRESMIGASIYICCTNPKTGDIVPNIDSCAMCKRLILNAGIEKVYFRETKDICRVIETKDWVYDDDSLDILKLGY